jgi:hypothetical protein
MHPPFSEISAMVSTEMVIEILKQQQQQQHTCKHFFPAMVTCPISNTKESLKLLLNRVHRATQPNVNVSTKVGYDR